MGFISRLLSFVHTEISEAKVSDIDLDPGGGANIRCQVFQDANTDSQPLVNDYTVSIDVPGQNKHAACGFLDPSQQQKSGPGEYRSYARNSDGVQVVEFWLKNDGSAKIENNNAIITIHPNGKIEHKNQNALFEIGETGQIKASNDSGFFDLTSSGPVNINGATIDTSGKNYFSNWCGFSERCGGWERNCQSYP